MSGVLGTGVWWRKNATRPVRNVAGKPAILKTRVNGNLCERLTEFIANTPSEVVFLKFRYRLGYESLCREVADSISWQRFCRIPFGTRVPHPTTLMKITTRCGEDAVAALNEALLVKAADAKVLKHRQGPRRHHRHCGRRCLSDRLGSAGQGDRLMARPVARIKAAGAATRTTVRDRRRSAGRRARSIVAKLKLRGEQQRDQAQAAVRRITGELAGIAEASDA